MQEGRETKSLLWAHKVKWIVAFGSLSYVLALLISSLTNVLAQIVLSRRSGLRVDDFHWPRR
jgi:hypothetical protein